MNRATTSLTRTAFALSVQRSIITAAADGPVPEDADTRPIYATDSDQYVGVALAD